MTVDPELRQLLFQLGENEAAKLWRVETVMERLRIPLKPEPEDQRELRRIRPQRAHGWHSRLLEDVERPAWKGKQPGMLSGPSRSGRNDSLDEQARQERRI